MSAAAPPYSLPSEDALVDHVKRIAGQTGLPIMLYNFPPGPEWT